MTNSPVALHREPRLAAASTDPYFAALVDAALLVPQYFGGVDTIRSATSLEDLKPDYLQIREQLLMVNFDMEAYLVALVGFFDDGQANRLEYVPRVHRIAAVMNQEQRRRIARLLEHFPA